MSYFLKKTPLKNRTYLAIYESFYSHEKKGTCLLYTSDAADE